MFLQGQCQCQLTDKSWALGARRVEGVDVDLSLITRALKSGFPDPGVMGAEAAIIQWHKYHIIDSYNDLWHSMDEEIRD